MPATFIDADELKQQLAQEKENIDSWAKHTLQSAKAVTAEHSDSRRRHNGTIVELGQQRDELRTEAQRLQQRLAAEAAVVQDLQSRLQDARATESMLPAEITELQQKLQQEFSQVQSREAALAAATAAQQADLATLQNAVACYSSRLSLRLETLPGQGELRVIFTHVDEAAPAREFSFGIHIQGHDVYEVRSCSPPVKEVAQYVDALNNKSVTFSEFVRTMRRDFCSIAAADAA